MKEAIVTGDTTIRIEETAIPEPGPGQILVKVLVSGTNPKDWKIPVWLKTEQNSGDDVAGHVEKVGANVSGFSKGDRVAGFHVMLSPHGSYAEYAIVPAFTTFHVPGNISLEEAATVPLAAYTSAVGMHYNLKLPSPWDPQHEGPAPVVIYGASSAIGAYAIKLLKKSDIHPVIAVGSKNSSFITPLLQKDKGDVFVDYTAFDSQDKLGAELSKILKGTGAKQHRAFDCVSSGGTHEMLSKALAGASPQAGAPKPLLAVTLPNADLSGVDPGVEVAVTSVGRVHKTENAGQLFGAVWTAALASGLSEGWLTPHPHECLQGLESLETALKGLRDGHVRGKKMVVRIAEGK